MDNLLACNDCYEYLLKIRCCKSCGLWLTPALQKDQHISVIVMTVLQNVFCVESVF